MEAFKAKERPLTAMYSLHRTPGDIALASWKLVGTKLKELHGAIVRYSKRHQPMHMVIMDHYIQEHAAQAQKSQFATHAN